MKRKLIVFGNGLGMALDAKFFRLDRALRDVWKESGVLDDVQRALILRCLLPAGRKSPPQGENDLDVLQSALAACEMLNSLGDDGIHFLADHAKKFPDATRRFVCEVAYDFHRFDERLPKLFIQKLTKFLRDSYSHVATLNYDKLLYQPFIEEDILCGYRGVLVDGLTDAGFSLDNFERRFGNQFGFYLHLHGSPLFVDCGDQIRKLKQRQRAKATEIFSRHLVLTHMKHKPRVIAASELLTAYWQQLFVAVAEVEEVILFGYSGLDRHLNLFLTSALRQTKKRVRVVEWEGAGEHDQRLHFWRSELDRQDLVANHVIRLPDVLQFDDW